MLRNKICTQTEDQYRLICNELTQQQLQAFDYKTKELVRKALANKNKFWNLLVDSAGFLDDELVKCIDIVSNLEDWPDLRDISINELTQKQYKLMNEGFQKIRQFIQNDDDQQRKALRRRWRKWRDQYDGIRLQIAIQQSHLKQSKNYSTFWENILAVTGSVAVVGGIVMMALSGPPGWIAAGCVLDVAGAGCIVGQWMSRGQKKHDAENADEWIKALDKLDDKLKARWDQDHKQIDKWLVEMIKNIKRSKTYTKAAENEYGNLRMSKLHWVKI